ncbi:hypothetical protein [Paenarthrobacter sp. 2TAF44]|uniref:hypothetical protein n=1 Tax=Paenarthrobacter sp. 2TAF44 TaxID=3233018 RepID=UPI003F97884E
MDMLPGLIETPAILRTGMGTSPVHERFTAGEMVRIRRGYYVDVPRWLEAKPWARFAWSLAAAARAMPDLILCRETSAFVRGLPILRTPPYVECTTPSPSRSGRRRPTLTVVGESREARQIRGEGGFPVRFYLSKDQTPELVGAYQCTGLVRTVMDIAFSSRLSQSLVVADGVARELWRRGGLPPNGRLLDVDEVAALLNSHPHEAARRRAELVLSLASPLPESVGESYSRAAFEYLGFEQPELQHDFSDVDGFIGRSDFWWPPTGRSRGVVGEFDGKAKYTEAELRNGASPEEIVYKEKLREDRIRALGFGFVRWGWAHIENPERLRSKLIGVGLVPAAQRR